MWVWILIAVSAVLLIISGVLWLKERKRIAQQQREEEEWFATALTVETDRFRALVNGADDYGQEPWLFILQEKHFGEWTQKARREFDPGLAGELIEMEEVTVA